MLIGNVSRRGGIFALQRENNAHGACDMGSLPSFLPGYQVVRDAQNRKKFEERWNIKLSEYAGLSALEMIEAANKRTIKAMFIMGENPVTGFPQPALVQKALSSLEFLVATDIFMTETTGFASVVLPAASFADNVGHT